MDKQYDISIQWNSVDKYQNNYVERKQSDQKKIEHIYKHLENTN